MELKSDPFTEETVIDLDVIFVGGLRDSITLRRDDTYKTFPGTVEVLIASTSEEIIMERRNILSRRLHTRTIRRPIKGTPVPPVPSLPENVA